MMALPCGHSYNISVKSEIPIKKIEEHAPEGIDIPISTRASRAVTQECHSDTVWEL